jgi:hypothetical protein
MANENPTGSGPAVAFTIPPSHVAFLRQVFETGRDGIRDDLAEYPDQLRDPARSRREEAVYGRLLAALDSGVIVPDRDTRDTLRELALVFDLENEYERALSEHRAFRALLGQVESGERH